MSSCLWNFKVSAKQSYLSLKTLFFRAQLCPTIGFYSCAEQNRLRNEPPSVLRKKQSERSHEVLFSSTHFYYEEYLNRHESSLTYQTASRCLKLKSVLCPYQVSTDSVFKPSPVVQEHYIISNTTCLSSFLVTEGFLCDQILDNITVSSSFPKTSLDSVLSMGAENPHLQRLSPFSDVEYRTMWFVDMPKAPTNSENLPGKPSKEQLHKNLSGKFKFLISDGLRVASTLLKLQHQLPRFFAMEHDYSIYHQNVIFVNNIRGIVTKGLTAYQQYLFMIRIMTYLRFGKVKLEILKTTQHPEDGTIRIRWRIETISLIKMLMKNLRKVKERQTGWIDGFSIFYVGADGLVCKHVCDKMMPNDDMRTVKTKNSRMGLKVALMLGLAPECDVFGELENGAVMPITSRKVH